MIRKVVWCLFILLVIDGNHCSPTERDLYAFSTLANTAKSISDGKSFGDKIQDSETAETNTHSNPYGGSIKINSEEDSLEDSQDDPPGPEDHVIPYSEHENPEEVPTKPKYVAPGTWAKPDPKKNIPLDFVPTKTLAQVRGTHTVKVLPQSEAIASATSDEERENAPRLREVVSKKKTNTVYTEEGYEDSAYDHGGHVRDADFHEGYARKLHDEHGTEERSGAVGQKKSKKKKNSKKKKPKPRPEEFEEFTDDYSDEPAQSDKYEAEGSSNEKKKDYANEIYKDLLKRPDLNPKFVIENEIEKLEHDLKKEAEEAEKGSENYGSGTKRDAPRDFNDEVGSSGNSEYSTKAEGYMERNTEFPAFETKENFYKENYEATTVEFETPRPGEPENYGNPTTSQYYLPDGSALRENYEATTFNYNYPNNQQSVIGDPSTTVNYGDVFWKYFQTKPNEATSPSSYFQEQTTIQQPLLLRETTTLGPFDEQNPPVALATINGHGPYLLVSENGVATQNPNQFGDGSIPYYPTLQNSHQSFNPNSIFNQEYGITNGQGINSRSGQAFSSFIDSDESAPSGYASWGSNNAAISTDPTTTRFYDNIAFSSTPTYSLIALPPNGYEPSRTKSEEDSSYRRNPFLNSAEDEAGSRDNYGYENFQKSYKNWLTNDQNRPAHGREQSGRNEDPNTLSSKSEGKKGMSFFGYKPNLEYTKMLSFIKNHENGRYNSRQKSESADSEDFTIMKPPTLRESMFSDFTLNSYPNVAGYSSVTQESEAVQESNVKKFDDKKNGTKHNGLSQKDMNFKTPRFYGNNLPAIGNRKRLFPASKLLPPPPTSKDNYAELNIANRNNGHYESSKRENPEYNPSYKSNKNYNPDPEKLARYLKNRRTPSRFTRSSDESMFSEDKIADALIAQEINSRFNFNLEDEGLMKYRDVRVSRKSKSRVKRNLIPQESPSVTEDETPLAKEIFVDEKESKIYGNHKLRNRRSHQDLLDASHKIAGDVIDEEINSRFKSKDYDAVDEEDDEEEDEDEEEDGARREKQVEIDPPDFDYLDEIQDVNDIENIPTTTIASIDLKKYPFYKSNKVPNSSPLKYIINPKEVPKKTYGGMEFYDSRDKYIQCDEVDPNLEEVVPDDEEPVPNRGPKENLPRLRGLGDKLDCFKAKYFGENPFDNPLFFEKKITQPTPPSELDPMKLVSRILELPKENRNYFVPAKSRKPETMSIKRIDNSHRRTERQKSAETSNVQSSAEPRTRRRNKADQSKVVESSTVKPQMGTRRTRKRRPVQKQQTTTTESPAVDSVTPYQKEVYEDVMGTIKNLASLYEMFGAQTTHPLTEATIISPSPDQIQGAPSIRNVKTSNRVPTFDGNREKDFHLSGVTEIPYHEEIEGLLPPPELEKKPKIMPYRTNKVSYNTRLRTESPTRNGDKKIVGYFRTVMVHKRSLDDPEIERNKHTVEKRNVMDSEFEETRTNLRSVDPNASSSTTEIPKRGRRRKTNLTTTTTTTQATIASDATTNTKTETPKPSYTIRSRSRNSKDEKSTGRYGLFTTTERPSTTIDSRRQEPRYTEIVRRRGQAATTTTTLAPSPQAESESNTNTTTVNPEVNGSLVEPAIETREIYESENSVPRRRKVSIEQFEPSSEIYKAIASDFEPERIEEADDDSENYEEEDEESTDKPVKNIRKYDVHEDVQEDTTPNIIGFPEPTKTSEYVDLESYLLTDPPGYSKAFADETRPTVPYENADGSGDGKENYRNEESKEEQVEDDDAEHHEVPQNASYQEEESSDEDGAESPKTFGYYKDSSSENGDESADEKKKSEQEDGDDKTFFRYNIRPNSPFESFEDDKYSELGPRVNKPAFYHPPFEAPKYERHYFDDSEEKEKDKSKESLESLEKEKYVFPWAQDEEDEKAEAQEGYVDEVTEKYEYPWEKRERLAEERAQRRKDRERLKKLKDFSFLHDDHDYDEDDDEKKGSSSKISGKRTYPWDLYDVPSKAYKKSFWKKDDFDSDETSSEHRPVAKFSSKYSSSKFKLPFAGSEPITTADPNKIRKSVLNFLKEADEKSVEPTVAYETDISTTIQPKYLTKSPDPDQEVESTKEPVSSGSKNNKRISNSRIIPENITTAPRNRNRTKVTRVRERTTLRPSVRSTTEVVAVTKAQTTTTPSTTTRRASRLRGGAHNTRRQPSYKAQESQIASSAVLPTSQSTVTSTTEKPVKSTTSRSPVRFAGRKRGRANTGETSSQNQETVTEISTQATIAGRRRTRPTIGTRLAATKTVEKKIDKPKRPSRVNTKNLVKETTYDEYRIPTMSSANSGDNIEDSTPTSRTVEHRSRVSKEEIITKTSFPEQDTMFKMYKDKSMLKKINPFNKSEDNRKSKKTYSKAPDRASNSFGERNAGNENPVRNESVEELSITTKETPEHVYEKKEIVDEDGNKGMFVSIIPKNRTIGPSALEDELHLKKAKMEELQKDEERGYGHFDDTKIQKSESNEDIGSTLPGDNLRENPPSSSEIQDTKDYSGEYASSEEDSSTEHEGRYRGYDESTESDEEVDKTEEESSVVKFEKDPSRRLYFYLEHRK